MQCPQTCCSCKKAQDLCLQVDLKLHNFSYAINYDVRIVAEGEDEHMDRFIKRIKINRFPIDVENVKVNFDDFKGEFEYFEIMRGEWGEEIVERLDTAGKLLYKSTLFFLKKKSVGGKEKDLF